MGIRLRPRGAVGLFGNDLRVLTDRALPPADVLPRISQRLQDAADRAGASPRDVLGPLGPLAHRAESSLGGSDERVARILTAIDGAG